MKISRTTIKNRTGRKTNSELVETLDAIRKNKSWSGLEVARYLSSASRKMPEMNLSKLSAHSEEGDSIILPGKVLGAGEIKHKMKVCAFKFSKQALDKLHEKKCETSLIIDEVNKNPKATGLRMLI